MARRRGAVSGTLMGALPQVLLSLERRCWQAHGSTRVAQESPAAPGLWSPCRPSLTKMFPVPAE